MSPHAAALPPPAASPASLGAGRTGTQALHRAALLLRLLCTHTSSGWRLTDLALEAGLDHSTTHRLLKGLMAEGLATRCHGSRHYTIGPFAYEMGLTAAPYFSIDSLARDALHKLADGTRTIVFLNVRSAYDSVCVGRYDGQKALMAFTVHVGTRRPLCLSAGGVAIWVSLPQRLQAQIRNANLHTIERSGEARRAAVRNMLRDSRRLGYGLNRGHIIPGITAVGVAIRNAAGEPFASLSLAFLDKEGSEKRRDELCARLRKEAAAIEATLASLRY